MEISQPRKRQIINQIATKIVKLGLETPAVFFLEMSKPLSFIASQCLLVAVPIFGPLVGFERLAEFSQLMGERENVGELIDRIEELSHQKGCDE